MLDVTCVYNIDLSLCCIPSHTIITCLLFFNPFHSPNYIIMSAQSHTLPLLTCDEATNAFCTDCHSSLTTTDPIMCSSILKQCRASFCKPLCLKLAWDVKVTTACPTSWEQRRYSQILQTVCT
jgi:hypothetical protein